MQLIDHLNIKLIRKVSLNLETSFNTCFYFSRQDLDRSPLESLLLHNDQNATSFPILELSHKIRTMSRKAVCIGLQNWKWFTAQSADFPNCLVSTYVVCERLSVMHEPAGVVEILVQILQNTPYSEEYPPPPPPSENWNLGRSWHFKTFQFQNTPTPPPKNWNLGTCWHFDFSVSEYPPKLKFRQILAL